MTEQTRSSGGSRDAIAQPPAAIQVVRFVQGTWSGLLPVAVVTIGLVAYVMIQRRDLGREVVASFTSVGPAAVAGALVLVVVQVLCQGFRFWSLLRGDIGLSRLLVLYAFSVGEIFNALIPARVGDAVKVMMLRRFHSRAKSGISRIIGGLLADKVLDTVTLVVLSAMAVAAAGYGLLSTTRVAPDLRWLVVGLVVILALFLATPFIASRGLAAGGGRFVRARRFARGVRIGFSVLREPRRILRAATFAVAGRLAEVCVIHVLCSSLGISLSIAAIVLAVAMLNVGIAIPLSIANLGAYEAALAFGLTVWGVPIAPAIAIAVAHHLIELAGIASTAGLVSIVWKWRAPPPARPSD